MGCPSSFRGLFPASLVLGFLECATKPFSFSLIKSRSKFICALTFLLSLFLFIHLMSYSLPLLLVTPSHNASLCPLFPSHLRGRRPPPPRAHDFYVGLGTKPIPYRLSQCASYFSFLSLAFKVPEGMGSSSLGLSCDDTRFRKSRMSTGSQGVCLTLFET